MLLDRRQRDELQQQITAMLSRDLPPRIVAAARPRREDHPLVTIWTKKDLGRLTANQDVLIVGQVSTKIKLPYIQLDNGHLIDNATAAEVLKHARTIFT